MTALTVVWLGISSATFFLLQRMRLSESIVIAATLFVVLSGGLFRNSSGRQPPGRGRARQGGRGWRCGVTASSRLDLGAAKFYDPRTRRTVAWPHRPARRNHALPHWQRRLRLGRRRQPRHPFTPPAPPSPAAPSRSLRPLPGRRSARRSRRLRRCGAGRR